MFTKYSTTYVVQQLKKEHLQVFNLAQSPGGDIRGYVSLPRAENASHFARLILCALPEALIDATVTVWLKVNAALGFTLPAAYPTIIGWSCPITHQLALPAPSTDSLRALRKQRQEGEYNRFIFDLGKQLAKYNLRLTAYIIGRDGQCLVGTAARTMFVVRTDGGSVKLIERAPDAARYRIGEPGETRTYECAIRRDDLAALLKDHVADHNALGEYPVPAPMQKPRLAPLPARTPVAATVAAAAR